MKRNWIALIIAAGLSPFAVAQTNLGGSSAPNTSTSPAKPSPQENTAQAGTAASGSAEANGPALATGATILAELTKSLDAKKVKAGDPVIAKTTQDLVANGHVVVQRGAKLVGHVTEAQARTKENPQSTLGIIFDRVVLKNGSEVNLNAVVQALAAPAMMSMGGDDMAPSGGSMPGNRPSPMGGGMMGPGTGASAPPNATVGSTANQPPPSSTGTAGGRSGGTLNSSSTGVIGLKGLSLNSSASGSPQASVISSDKETVKLDSGTQMVLRTMSPAQH